jgi:PKD repeat protein
MPRLWAAVAGTIVLVTAGGACHKMPLVAPSGTAITLTAATNVLPVNGSVEITAVLIEGGQQAAQGQNQQATTAPGVGTPVHNGTLVTFTTTLGRIEPAEARTTAGRATVRLIADGRSGTATVRAFSGGASNTLDVAVGAAGAARIILTANPQVLPANGGSTTVTARVEDAQGNGLLGVPVSFSTSAGTLAPTSGLSDNNGLVNSVLTATAQAEVTARAGGGTGAGSTLSDTVTVTIRPRIGITLTPPTSATVSTPASFTVAVDQTSVVTDILLDFGDGDDISLGAFTGSRTVIHLYSDDGIYTVRMIATDTDGVKYTSSTQLAVGALEVTLGASPVSVVIDTPVTFTITVSPAAALISRYEWDFGDGTSTTTSGKQTSHVYSATAIGTRTVTARAIAVAGGAHSALIQIQVKDR